MDAARFFERLAPFLLAVLAAAEPSERQQLDPLRIAQPIDRVGQLLASRIVGARLEHIAVRVVGWVGARILVDWRHFSIELSRLSDDIGKRLDRDRQHKGSLDWLVKRQKAALWRSRELNCAQAFGVDLDQRTGCEPLSVASPSSPGDGEVINPERRRIGASLEFEIVGGLEAGEDVLEIAGHRHFADRKGDLALVDPEAGGTPAVVAGHA